MSHVHTLQSDSKTHVHTLQQFDEFFKKIKSALLQFLTMWILWDRKCEYGFFHITHAKNSSNHSSSTRDLTRFFGICDVEKAILTFPPHSILSFPQFSQNDEIYKKYFFQPFSIFSTCRKELILLIFYHCMEDLWLFAFYELSKRLGYKFFEDAIWKLNSRAFFWGIVFFQY